MYLTTDVITPDVARELLGTNTNNRNVRRNVVSKYASDMKAGKWLLDGSPIRRGIDGTLLGGQHRLLACIQADTQFETAIAWDVPIMAQATMDTNAHRTFADLLKMRGEKNSNNIAAMVRGVAALQGGRLRSLVTTMYSHSELWEVWEKNDEWCRDRVRQTCALTGVLKVRTGIVAALMWQSEQIDADDAVAFWERLSHDYGHAQGEPIYQLRKQLSAQRRDAMLSPGMSAALIIKAWNKYRAGEACQLLRFVAGGANPEQFPEMK